MRSFLLVWWVALATVARVRPRRDFAGLTERRNKAAKLFAKGKTQAEVARELEVSRQSASRWYAGWHFGGTTALKGAGRAGRLPKLSTTELQAIASDLEKGPRANGFSTELWTIARVGEVIAARTGVSYHPGHVWRILHQMGWSRQQPARRAVERDDEAIARWVRQDWPRVKETPDAAGPGSALRTSRGSRSSPR